PSATSATYTNHTGAPPPAVPCMPDQASALLRLKRSFSVTNKSVIAFRSWNAGEDCCRWAGVRCGGGADGGRVTWLDLGDRGLKSGHLDQVIFKLNSQEYLNLGGNDFNLSEIPSTGFERLNFFANLSSLSVLQLSFNHLEGWVPPLIFQKKKLVAIDLHRNVGLSGTLPDFPVDSSLEILLVGHTNFSGTIPSFISNLKSLKKLGLDASGFSGVGSQF
ncbi:hypothetical protein EE612_000404, partial [Oryza sativa]